MGRLNHDQEEFFYGGSVVAKRHASSLVSKLFSLLLALSSAYAARRPSATI